MYGSVPALKALRRRFFADFTADSSLLFALLFPGELVLCSKSQSFANFRNSDDAAVEVVLVTRTISQKLLQ